MDKWNYIQNNWIKLSMMKTKVPNDSMHDMETNNLCLNAYKLIIPGYKKIPILS